MKESNSLYYQLKLFSLNKYSLNNYVSSMKNGNFMLFSHLRSKYILNNYKFVTQIAADVNPSQ